MNKHDDTITDDAIRAYSVLTSVTGTALFVSSICSFATFTDMERIAKGTHINNKVNKFTAICAFLFGAEIAGGLLWQKLATKKANNKTDSFAHQYEQQKLTSPKISVSR